MGFAEPSVVIHSVSLNDAHKQTTVGEFLPDAFSFKQFTPDALQPSNIGELSVADIEKRLTRQGELTEAEIFTWLESLEGIDHATQTSQVAVLKISGNRYVAGVSIEEAAYVSIEPIQNALAIANTAYGNDFKVEAVWALSRSKKQLEATPSSSSSDFPLLQAFKKKSQQTQDESFIPLPLSSIQVLAQFAVDGSIPIQLFNGRGNKEVIALRDSAQCIPTFAQPLTTKSVDSSKRMSYV